MTKLSRDGTTLYLLSWIQGGDSTSLYAAWIDDIGDIVSPPRKISPETTGTYSHLHLRPAPNGQAVLAGQHHSDTVTLREFSVGLPTSVDCDGDGVADALAIANGSVPDCNTNGVPDLCDISLGTSKDRNQNSIPDECEAPLPDDCNRNGISDRDEIFLELVADTNANGVPDDCETVVITLQIPIATTERTRFYRAQEITIKTQTSTTFTIEYRGTLEQASALEGPWTPVAP